MQQTLGTASLLGSLVLVVVTVWYAWQTQQMVREMRHARIAALRPCIRLDLGLIGATAYLNVENVGVGPAANVTATIAVKTEHGEHESHIWTKALLRSGESQTLLMPRRPDGSLMTLSSLKELGAEATIHGSCLDLDGRAHDVHDTLSFSILGDRDPEGSWEGVVDRWPKNVEKIAKELEQIRKKMDNGKTPWQSM